jgi:hypothetical protein
MIVMSEDWRANPAASTSAGPGIEEVPGLDARAHAGSRPPSVTP